VTESGYDRFSELPETQMLRINQVCDRFEQAWQAGTEPGVESFLSDAEPVDRPVLTRELIAIEIRYRRDQGLSVSLHEYQRRFPDVEQTWLIDSCSTHQSNSDQQTDETEIPQRLGEYRIISCIGEGGMGTVYKAEHEIMGRTVALKVLRTEIRSDTDLLLRFQREVRTAARLSHPNVVTAYDAGTHAGVHYLITEYVDGQDLQQIVTTRGPLSQERAVQCILQAARGLAYAHKQGVIHRDIKPSNLLLDRKGRVKILDMGLARLEADDQASIDGLTTSGMVLGTLAYMAPEQAVDTRTADARSDIYSLGCTLYYLLTGRHVFDGDTVTEQIHAHARQAAPSLADSGKRQSLDVIFRKMVRKSPEDRYQTMAELVAVLKELRETQAAPTAQVTQSPQNQPASTRHPTEVDFQAVQQASDGLPASRSVRKRRTRLTQARSIGWFSGKPFIIVSTAAALLILIAVLKSSRDHDTSRSPNGDGNTHDVVQDNPGDNRRAPDQSGFSTDTGLSFNGESSYVVAETLKRRDGDTATLEAVVVQQESRRANIISWLGPDWMALFSDGYGWGIARRVGNSSHLIVSLSEARIGKRTHLAGVWDGENLHLFINGVPAETRPVEFEMSETSGGLYIGGVPQNLLPPGENDRFFNGLIEAVRISNGVRYTTGFDPGALEPESSTLALYRFNQVQGPTVPDSSDNGHAATIVGAEPVTD